VLDERELRLISEVREKIAVASRVLFVTGAGISADAGLPTYRGVGGLYAGEPTAEGVPIEEALSGRMLQERPSLCWKYIRQIEEAGRGAMPSAGHRAIAALQTKRREVWVLTQNVDGLHTLAGSRRVIDIHGDIKALRCTRCGDERRVSSYENLEAIPHCRECGGMLRPKVVLFGERLPVAKLERLDHELGIGFDVVVNVGTSAVFTYIARPTWITNEKGALTVEVDPGETRLSQLVDIRFRRRASEVLPSFLPADV